MTYRQIFQTFPEPYSSQAIQNCMSYHKYDKDFIDDEETSSTAHALMTGFSWQDTPEGGEYWKSFFYYIKAKEDETKVSYPR